MRFQLPASLSSCLRQVPPPCEPNTLGGDRSNEDGDDDGGGDAGGGGNDDGDNEEEEEEEEGCHV